MTKSRRLQLSVILFLLLGIPACLFIFWLNPVRMKHLPSDVFVLDDNSIIILKLEVVKIFNEIQNTIKQQNEWHHKKMLLIGGIVAGIFFVFSKNSDYFSSQKKSVDFIFYSEFLSTSIAVSVLVSLAIDMHVRGSFKEASVMGDWVAKYIEPAFLASSNNIIGWEGFLRQVQPSYSHIDSSIQLLFGPGFHEITMVLYFSYVILLHLKLSRQLERWQYNFTLFCLILVNTSMTLFSMVVRSPPDGYEVQVTPFSQWHLSGWRIVAIYAIPGLALFLAELPLFRRLVLEGGTSATESN